MAITAFLSHSPGLLNRGPEGPLCWVLVFSTASYLQLQLLNREPEGPLCWVLAFSTACYLQLQLLNRGPEGPLCWVLAFSTASCLQLSDFLSSPGLYYNLTPTILPASVTISHSFNPSTVKVIIS